MGTGQRLVSDQALEACGVQEFHPAPIKQICWHLFVLRSWPGNSTARQAFGSDCSGGVVRSTKVFAICTCSSVRMRLP